MEDWKDKDISLILPTFNEKNEITNYPEMDCKFTWESMEN